MGRSVPADVLPQAAEDSLTVIDNRTGKAIKVPIKDNAVPATALKQLKADTKVGERAENETEGGLRVFDSGYQNTAVISSRITYIDGERVKARFYLQWLGPKRADLLVFHH